jgi:hypothetical protein
MRGLACKTILAAAIAGCGLFVAASANAHDGDRWDRWDYRHHHGRWHDDDRPRRVVVERQPIIVAPAPRPVILAPMAPAYGYAPPADPSVNFNFSFPMR